MAAAFGVPSVVIFGPVRPGHLGALAHGLRSFAKPGGIGRVETAQVLEALARLKVAA